MTDDRYERVKVQGQWIDKQMAQGNAAVEKICGYPAGSLTVIKGGDKPAADPNSGSTHLGLSVEDTTATADSHKVATFALLGFVPFPRDSREGYAPHTHVVTDGGTDAHATAEGQVGDRWRGMNGMTGHYRAKYRGPTMHVRPIFVYQHPGESHDLSPRWCIVPCHKYAQPGTAKAITNLGEVHVGERVDPVAVVKVGTGYWLVDAKGACHYEANFSKTAPSTTPPVVVVDPPTVTPAPVGATVGGRDTTLVVAYGNTGPTNYILTDADRARLRKEVQLIHDMGVSLFVALELHEENGKQGALSYFRSQLRAGWGVFEGKGGNHLVADFAKYKLLHTVNTKQSGRWFTRWNIQRIDTGLAFWIEALHTTAGTTPSNVLDRSRQAKAAIAGTDTIQRGLWAWDKNNYTASPGSPTKQLKAAGIVSMYDAGVTVKNAKFNSHHDAKDKGNHIDFLGFRPAFVTMHSGEQVRTGFIAGMDHDWLKLALTIKGTA